MLIHHSMLPSAHLLHRFILTPPIWSLLSFLLFLKDIYLQLHIEVTIANVVLQNLKMLLLFPAFRKMSSQCRCNLEFSATTETFKGRQASPLFWIVPHNSTVFGVQLKTYQFAGRNLAVLLEEKRKSYFCFGILADLEQRQPVFLLE